MCSRTTLDLIRRRPSLYFLNVTYSALAAYIHGTQAGIYETMKALELKTEPPIFQEYEWTWELYFYLWAKSKRSGGLLELLEINNSNISDRQRFDLFFQYLDEFEQEMESRGREIVLQELEQFKVQSRSR